MTFSRRRPAGRRRPGEDEKPAASARLTALRLLGRRDLTASELTARLIEKGYGAADAAGVVQQLIDEHAVDDRRTALAYAEAAARIKGRGRLRVKRELEARGVSRAIVEDVLADALPAENELAAIRRFLARKGSGDRASPAGRRRLYGQLLRRGFAPDAIGKALKYRPGEED